MVQHEPPSELGVAQAGSACRLTFPDISGMGMASYGKPAPLLWFFKERIANDCCMHSNITDLLAS